jgi:hypothetical protein
LASISGIAKQQKDGGKQGRVNYYFLEVAGKDTGEVLN